jgi:hypothetical protein
MRLAIEVGQEMTFLTHILCAYHQNNYLESECDVQPSGFN